MSRSLAMYGLQASLSGRWPNVSLLFKTFKAKVILMICNLYRT